jgi:hypothetical protein
MLAIVKSGRLAGDLEIWQRIFWPSTGFDDRKSAARPLAAAVVGIHGEPVPRRLKKRQT